MNVLPLSKRIQIINLLVEGNSLRAAARICDVSRNTVSKLLRDVGKACIDFHDKKILNINAKRVQCDEIWSFVYSKRRNVPEGMEDKAGDAWTWVGMDADTKLIISYLVGSRDAGTANIFMQDVAGRINGRVQLTTDGYRAYIDAVDTAFGNDIDYAQLVKIYGGYVGDATEERRYSASACVGMTKTRICGSPDERYIKTSGVERQNLTMRMHMRRFTRLTNAFSKKIEFHTYAVALHFVYYNFCKIHKTLRVTPAMEAGLTDDVMEIKDIINLVEISN